jgi:gliding motility-associated-like protein
MSTPIDTLGIDDSSFTYTSTAPGGELTFYYWWQDEGSDFTANIGCISLSGPLVISTQPVDEQVCQNNVATFTTSASGPNSISYQWQTSPDKNTWTDLSDGGDFGGAKSKVLTINASNLTDEAWYRCNIKGDNGTEANTNNVFLTVDNCGTPELVVYNAVSPNNDGKNEYLLIENVDVIPSKKDNMVKIFNRWGDEVFAVANYNNKERVFNGTNKNGNKLPSGIYFYKISFTSDPEITGYLELKY